MDSGQIRGDRWQRYLLELLVVFFGVTAAFLLNSWRENRQTATLEQSYLRFIASDLRQDRELLEALIASRGDHDRAFQGFLGNPAQDRTVDVVLSVIAGSLDVTRFAGKSTTYESMKYSGHLSVIGDIELRSKIVDYYESFSHAAVLDALVADYAQQYLIPFYMEHLDMAQIEATDFSVLTGRSYANRLQGLRTLAAQTLTTYREMLDENDRLLSALET